MRSIVRRVSRLAASLVLAGAVAGCASVTLVPAYDEQIDSGLTTLYGDTISFVDRTGALAGTPEGAYAANSAFYDNADARVDALIVRAEAHRVLKDCPSTKVLNRAFAATAIPADVRGTIGTLPADDCQVVLLRLIRGGFGDMRTFHRAQGVTRHSAERARAAHRRWRRRHAAGGHHRRDRQAREIGEGRWMSKRSRERWSRRARRSAAMCGPR